VYIQLTTLCLDGWGCVFEGYGSDFWVGVIDFILKVKFLNLENELIYNQTLVEKHNFNKI
tara:strand:+ start:289 stop:468 length:180 start_codon:yes stop_codon:yes gene_type:complete